MSGKDKLRNTYILAVRNSIIFSKEDYAEMQKWKDEDAIFEEFKRSMRIK